MITVKARAQLQCSFPFFSFQFLHSACIPHLAMLCRTDYRLVLKSLSPAKPEAKVRPAFWDRYNLICEAKLKASVSYI